MTLNYPFPIGIPSSWVAPEQIPIPHSELANWLLDSGSLTSRLQALCQQFQLILLGQRQADISQEEFTQVSSSQKFNKADWQVREVLLCGDGIPWVFARSIIPQRLCEQDFVDLNTQPLGHLIFNDKRFQRQPIEVCKMTDSSAFLAQLGIATVKEIWGRRSVFCFEQQKMMVSEMFLPNAPAYKLKD
ncbi:chorismate--pyruvate lyase family protein [Paraglaciecola aestuariivivens]